MKRISLFCVVCLAWWPGSLLAQNSAAADALERKNFAERLVVFSTRLDDIEQTQDVLRKRYDRIERQLEALAKEILEAKDKSLQSGAKFATREELAKYVKDLQEIDRKREADKALFLQSFKELSKIPLAPAHVDTKPAADPPEASGEYTVYTVKESGETLGDIIREYNKTFKDEGRPSIAIPQVVKLNPGLNPDRIRPKQKIRIPIPPKKAR